MSHHAYTHTPNRKKRWNSPRPLPDFLKDDDEMKFCC